MTAAPSKLTGPGQEQKLPDGSTLLSNFDIDSSVLKPQHTAFLRREVLAAAKANPGGLLVVIGGSTDRLGDATHNVALSNRRIQAVANFLKQTMPAYPWDFQGFGEGVGEQTAIRAGDDDGTRDDIFRSVIVEVLKPGQPIPPRPNIPKSFPKKPGDVPKPDRNESFLCLTTDQVPAGQVFSVRIQSSIATGFLGALTMIVVIQDVRNQLECEYRFTGIDATNTSNSIGTADGLKPHFFQANATKVTNFTSANITGSPNPLSSKIDFKFTGIDGKSQSATSAIDLDASPIPRFIVGNLSLLTTCVGTTGARKLNP
jgi:hypothetical protein